MDLSKQRELLDLSSVCDVNRPPLVRILSLCLCLALLILGGVLAVRQYGGWNFAEEQGRYNRVSLAPGETEASLLRSFARIQRENVNYTVGILSVSDHTPVFGGPVYRVYEIGYYDADKQHQSLSHVVCERGKITRVFPTIPDEDF